MNEQKDKLNMLKVISAILVIIGLTFLVRKGINILKNISKVYVVEVGSLKFEESIEGYVLRDEKVLQGENYKNGMIQIVSEGQRISKNSPAFRYYSNGEEDILNQINTLDDEINAEIESSGLTIFSTDITNLENEIEDVVDSMYQLNDLENIRNKIAELDTYISKKTKITGNLSPGDSHIKSLIEQRNSLESQLTNSSELVNSPASGIISYRIDGLEEILRRK